MQQDTAAPVILGPLCFRKVSMVNMNKMLFTLLLLVVSCTQVDNYKKTLIGDIVNNPSNIQEICKNNSFDMSYLMSESLQHPEPLVDVLLKFDNKFVVLDVWHLKDEHGTSFENIYITDSNKKYVVNFQFKKTKKWILYNIVLRE